MTYGWAHLSMSQESKMVKHGGPDLMREPRKRLMWHKAFWSCWLQLQQKQDRCNSTEVLSKNPAVATVRRVRGSGAGVAARLGERMHAAAVHLVSGGRRQRNQPLMQAACCWRQAALHVRPSVPTAASYYVPAWAAAWL